MDAYYRDGGSGKREALRPLIDVIERAAPGVVELAAAGDTPGFRVRLAERPFPERYAERPARRGWHGVAGVGGGSSCIPSTTSTSSIPSQSGPAPTRAGRYPALVRRIIAATSRAIRITAAAISPHVRRECGTVPIDDVERRSGERAVAQVRGELRGGLVAVVGVLGKALGDHPLEALGQLGPFAAHRGRRILDMHARQLEPVRVRKRHLPRRGLIEGHAQRVEIGALVHGAAQRLLGREVLRRADRHVHAGRGDVTRHRARDPEVGDHRLPIGAEQDVVGFQVAVDESRLMGEAEARSRCPRRYGGCRLRGGGPRAPAVRSSCRGKGPWRSRRGRLLWRRSGCE